MTRTEKNHVIDEVTQLLSQTEVVYLADLFGMTVEKTSALRRKCFERNIQLHVIKNTLLQKAMERSGQDFSDLFPVLKGNTAIMVSETGNAPGKLIKEFKRVSDKLKLKGAYVGGAVFVGIEHLDALASIKSKDELIGDVVLALQSPMRNVIGALQNNGGQGIAGLLKALEERAA
jgi:large subunit ribosomal protein L10